MPIAGNPRSVAALSFETPALQTPRDEGGISGQRGAFNGRFALEG